MWHFQNQTVFTKDRSQSSTFGNFSNYPKYYPNTANPASRKIFLTEKFPYQPNQILTTSGMDPHIESLAREFSSVKMTQIVHIMNNSFDPST